VTVRELIELLQQQRPTKKIYLSGGASCVEMKQDNVIDLPWGLTFR
jgi:quinolinate synthase